MDTGSRVEACGAGKAQGMSRSIVGAIFVIGALLVPMAAGAQEQAPEDLVVEPSRQVTTDPNPVRLYVTPSIAVDPRAPSTLAIAVADARSGGCGLVVSQDGGLSWQRTAQTLLPENQSFCVQNNFGPVTGLAFGRDGTLYTAMSGSSLDTGHPRGPIDALFARSTELGRTHETVTVAESAPYRYEPESGPAEEGFEQNRLVNMAVDPGNPEKVYMGWRQGIGGTTAPSGTLPLLSMVAVSDDGGRSWSEPFSLMDAFGEEVAGSDTPMLVVGPGGTAYAFTKERPRPPEEGQPRPPSRLFMATLANGGESWTTTVISEGAPFIDNPGVAIDPNNGNLYLTYASRGQEETDPSQAYVMISTDKGETWSAPVNIGDPDAGASYDKYFPGASVAPNGRVDIAWFDFRNDPFFTPGGVGPMGTLEALRYWDVYYASSADGGQTWSRNVRVTDRSVDGDVGVTFNNQDIRGPIGVASTNDMTYFAWADSRAGGPDFDAEDTYFTRVRHAFGEPVTSAPAPGPSRILWSLVGAGVALALGGVVLVAGTRMARRGAPAAERATVRAPE